MPAEPTAMAYRILTRDEHYQSAGPKRILALDGGGLRGMLSLGILRRLEAVLRERHGGAASFRLGHYFDLIAGTSTGAIIAAALAKGLSVDEVIGHYQRLGRQVFSKSWLRDGVVRARYDEETLSDHLRKVFGADTTLGDPSVQTGLLIVTKRFDTGSPWPLGNNPRGKYYGAAPGSARIANADFPLWKVVRASTAAPSFFDPERLTIATGADKKTVDGTFVDGGVSPFNNPSLQAVMYATLAGHGVNWATGADRLLLVSVGTGTSSPATSGSHIAAKGAIRALVSLMNDCGSLVETMMQWMSESPTARAIDRQVGTLAGDLIGGAPLLSYLRYNLMLAEVDAVKPGIPPDRVATLGALDDPDNLDLLLELGDLTARRDLRAADLGRSFDLAE